MKIAEYLKYYIGAPCSFGSEANGWIAVLDDVGGCSVKLNGVPKLEYVSQDDVKPVLRKMEDMTEEEMIGLLQSMVPADMKDKPADDDYDIELFHNDGGLMVDNDVAIGADFECICASGQIAIRVCGTIDYYANTNDRARLYNLPHAYHYLLSRGYDVFGLIRAGLAIDAKTLSTPSN